MMKNMMKNILIGIILPLFYFFVVNIMRYTILSGEYNENYALFGNILIVFLPSLPGISLMFLLIRNSMKEFFESLGVCFWVSFVVMLAYMISGIDLMIYTTFTGYEEFSLGDGLIMVITMECYFVSCLIGTIVSGIATYVKKRKVKRNLENQ